MFPLKKDWQIATAWWKKIANWLANRGTVRLTIPSVKVVLRLVNKPWKVTQQIGAGEKWLRSDQWVCCLVMNETCLKTFYLQKAKQERQKRISPTLQCRCCFPLFVGDYPGLSFLPAAFFSSAGIYRCNAVAACFCSRKFWHRSACLCNSRQEK